MANGILNKLQIELCKLQDWLQETGERAIIIFEGRDSAGKGGMIKTIQDRVSHRVFRGVALPKPTKEESSQWHFQRYIQHCPSAGEVVLFDRSWYNRAGAERVRGFCQDALCQRIFRNTPTAALASPPPANTRLMYGLQIPTEVLPTRLGDRQEDPR